MKKRWLIIITLPLLFLLASCSNLEAEHASSNHIEYVVKGTDKNKSIFWSTESDGVNKVKTDSENKFHFGVPYQNESFTLKVADNEDMKKAKTFKVKKAQKLMNYDDFVDGFNDALYGLDEGQLGDYDIDDISIDGSNPQEGFNKAVKAGSTTLYLNYNDGKILGARIQTTFDDDSDAHLFSAMLMISGDTFGSNMTTINGALDKFINQDGDEETVMKSKGIHYNLSGVRGSLITCDIYK